MTTKSGRVSPFGYLRVNACLSARRSFSQISTSFIASYRLGIPRMRLFAWLYNPKLFGSSFSLNTVLHCFLSQSCTRKYTPSFVRSAPCLQRKLLRQPLTISSLLQLSLCVSFSCSLTVIVNSRLHSLHILVFERIFRQSRRNHFNCLK